MTLTLDHQDGTNILEVGVSGKLSTSDFETLSAQVKRMLKPLPNLRIVVILRRFEGWEAGARWADVPDDKKHLKHVEQLAVVGPAQWEAGMDALTEPFSGARVQYFPDSRLNDAVAWLNREAKKSKT